MLSKRQLLFASLSAICAASVSAAPAWAHHTQRKNFKIASKYLPKSVRFKNDYQAGMIVVNTDERYLYLIENRWRARRYGVGVGRAGLAFKGTAVIKRKAQWPSWTPTANMIRREPDKYLKYANGLPGGINNPLGARALYLYKGGRDTYFRIHGTTEPWSIGQSMSSGCIRMLNDHVEDLYERVPIGTQVVVI